MAERRIQGWLNLGVMRKALALWLYPKCRESSDCNGDLQMLIQENARLQAEATEHKLQLDRALEFVEQASADLARTRVGVAPFLRTVGQAAARLFSPASIDLMLDRDPHGAARVSESHGLDPASVGRLRQRLAEAGTADPAWSQWPAALCLPISLDGLRHGHMEVFLAGEGRSFGKVEQSILQAFAYLTSSALSNAGLVGELRRAVSDAERAYMGTLEALTRVLELRDFETEGHCRRVVQYTLAVAQQLTVSEEDLVPIMRGALLHDIGKIAIPDGILRKPGPLSPEEWRVMRTHTTTGYEMLYPIDFLRSASPIILYHHERYDGSGYPHGLLGREIPVGARIFAVADAYDAITSDRPYRHGRCHGEAMSEISRCAGSHFDPEVVEAFCGLPVEELSRIRENWLSPATV